MTQPRVAVVGPGRVGRTLSIALPGHGHPVVAVVDRGEDPAPIAAADVVILSVPDDAIAPVFADLAARRAILAKQVVIHCSGLVSADALATQSFHVAGRASLHPMMAFASTERSLAALPGTSWGIEGDPRGSEVATSIAVALGGRAVPIPQGAKVAYHLSCVLASNGLVALADMAAEVAASMGVDGEDMARGLARLMSCTVDNLAALGIRPSMTGPVPRGDALSVALHAAALPGLAPEIGDAYAVLMRRLSDMALAEGRIDPGRHATIVALLDPVKPR